MSTATGFHHELNQKNLSVIEELNKQIDALSLVPLKDLDPFETVDVLEIEGNNSKQDEPTILKTLPDNVSYDIEQDLREFKALTEENKDEKQLERFLSEMSKSEADITIDRNDISGLSHSKQLEQIRSRDLPTNDNTVNTGSVEPHEVDAKSIIQENSLMTALRSLQDRVGDLEGERKRSKQKIKQLEFELEKTRKSLATEKMSKMKDLQSNVGNTLLGNHHRQNPSKHFIDGSVQTDDSLVENCDMSQSRTINDKTNSSFQRNLASFDGIEQDLKREFRKYAESLVSGFGPKNVVSDTGVCEDSFKISLTKERPNISQKSKETDPKRQSIGRKLSKSSSKCIKKHEDSTKHCPVSVTENPIIRDRVPDKKHTIEPAWKNVNHDSGTRAKSSAKAVAHTRIKGRIEVPNAVGSLGSDSTKREMPFIVGKASLTKKNAGKSFSVTANLQRVFSMLKSHHPDLCTVCNKKGNFATNDQLCVHDSVKAVHSSLSSPAPTVRVTPHPPANLKSYETLKGMAGILKSEYSQASKY